jgi:hypothetical protein
MDDIVTKTIAMLNEDTEELTTLIGKGEIDYNHLSYNYHLSMPERYIPMLYTRANKINEKLGSISKGICTLKIIRKKGNDSKYQVRKDPFDEGKVLLQLKQGTGRKTTNTKRKTFTRNKGKGKGKGRGRPLTRGKKAGRARARG